MVWLLASPLDTEVIPTEHSGATVSVNVVLLED
jgi:hypothetical protein